MKLWSQVQNEHHDFDPRHTLYNNFMLSSIKFETHGSEPIWFRAQQFKCSDPIDWFSHNTDVTNIVIGVLFGFNFSLNIKQFYEKYINPSFLVGSGKKNLLILQSASLTYKPFYYYLLRFHTFMVDVSF